MGSSENARSEDWKDKYFKALNELDEQERLRAEALARSSRDLLTVLERFRGLAPSYDHELAELGKAQGLHGDQQQSRLHGLVATLERLAKPAPALLAVPPTPAAALATAAPDGAAPLAARPSEASAQLGEETTLAARDALQTLIDHLSLPEGAQARLSALTPQLQKARDGSTVRRLAKELAGFIAEHVSKLHGEIASLNSFLVVIKTRLGEVAGFIQSARHDRNAAATARANLDLSVQHSLSSLRTHVAEASSIERLKQDIQAQISLLDGNVAAYLESESTRSAKVDDQQQDFSRHVAELERQTDSLRRKLAEAQDRALRDTLTGLPNRLAYDERMRVEYARWRRNGHALAVVVIDIDKFKAINDTWGHQAGDRVLKHLARELSSQIRVQDFFGRYGGEEFVLLLPDTTRTGAFTLADGLRRHIENTRFKFKDAPVSVTISCGLAELAAGDTVESVFARADTALYAAKEHGRNRCEGLDTA